MKVDSRESFLNRDLACGDSNFPYHFSSTYFTTAVKIRNDMSGSGETWTHAILCYYVSIITDESREYYYYRVVIRIVWRAKRSDGSGYQNKKSYEVTWAHYIIRSSFANAEKLVNVFV